MRAPQTLVIAIMTIALTGWQNGGPAVEGMSNGSAAPSERELEKLLESFADAWNRHDVNALMSMMTDDGVFEASAGTEVDGAASRFAGWAIFPATHKPSPASPSRQQGTLPKIEA